MVNVIVAVYGLTFEQLITRKKLTLGRLMKASRDGASNLKYGKKKMMKMTFFAAFNSVEWMLIPIISLFGAVILKNA